MKTLIVGMGNIGIIHGWALSEAGVDVAHVVRPGKARLYEAGIKLDVLDLREGCQGRRQAVYHPRVVDGISPGDGYELVMIATRYYQVVETVRQYRDLAPEAAFLLFTSNWDGPGEVDALLPRSRYAWGYSAVNGGFDGDTLLVNMRPDYRFGRMDGNPPELIDTIVELFGRAGLRPDFKDDIINWLWVHHATNAGLQSAALYRGGMPELLGDPAMRMFMVYAVRDAFAVLEARGVDLSRFPDARPFLDLPADEYSERFAAGILDSEYGQRVLKANHVKDNPEEMVRIYHDVLATGEQLGVRTPHLSVMRERIDARLEA